MKALVLAGGGSKISHTVGVLEQLKGEKYDVLVGTSAGALAVTALSYIDLEGLKDLMFGIKERSDVFSFAWSNKGVFSSEPLAKMVNDIVKHNDPSVPAWVCAVRLEDSAIVYSCSGDTDFPRMVVASCSIPGVVVPLKWNGETYVDGGIRENCPVTRARQLGATEIDVVLCNPIEWDTTWQPLDNDMFPAAHYLTRAFDIMTHEVLINDLSPGCRVWAPAKDLGGMLDFGNARELYELGKAATFKVI